MTKGTPSQPTMPVGIRRYRVAQACHVGDQWLRRDDLVLLLDGDHVEDVAQRWEPSAQREEHVSVLLEEISHDYVPSPRQRLVPILPTSTTAITPYTRRTYPAAD